jgi:hypothetical protein
MPLRVAQTIVSLFELYAVAGVLFALCFLPRAVAQMDPGLTQAPWVTRLLILPGTAALWPLFARRWLTGKGPPTERNPHRVRAAGR